MRKLLCLVLLLAVLPAAQAQIIGVHLDEKGRKKFRDQLVPFGGKEILIGEIKAGFTFKDDVISYSPSGSWELWLVNPDDPGSLPYKLKNGEKLSTGGKGVARGAGADIDKITILDEYQTLQGMAEEYKTRHAALEEALLARDAIQPKGSPAWMTAHQQLMSQYERLQSWLSGTGFAGAAKKLAKEIERQRKGVAAALRARVDAAKEVIAPKPTPRELIDASKKITAGKINFKVMESQHVRLVYMDVLEDGRMHALLEFAEDVIDGFRTDCIDPYVPELDDRVPEGLFAEFWFGPEDINHHEHFWTDYYGFGWGDRKAERLDAGGTGADRPFAPESVHYWKYTDASDLEGMVAHGLGHDLADLQYNGTLRGGNPQDWVQEGVGYYLSFEFLGRNNVTCKAFAPPAEYVSEKRKEAKMEEGLGLRDLYTALALADGPPLQPLSLRILAEFEARHIAKSWSFYDYLVKVEGLAGQKFLRAACETARDKKTFIAKWREIANGLFDVQGRDVFDELDARWRKAVESGATAGGGERAR